MKTLIFKNVEYPMSVMPISEYSDIGMVIGFVRFGRGYCVVKTHGDPEEGKIVADHLTVAGSFDTAKQLWFADSKVVFADAVRSYRKGDDYISH